MTAESGTVKVAPIHGEAFRYTVESWASRNWPHRVDLRSLAWNGECSCDDFKRTCIGNICHQIELSGTFRPIWYGTVDFKNPRRTRCRHIQAAAFWVYDNINPLAFPPDRTLMEVIERNFGKALQKFYERSS